MSVTPETALNEPRTEDDADALGKKHATQIKRTKRTKRTTMMVNNDDDDFVDIHEKISELGCKNKTPYLNLVDDMFCDVPPTLQQVNNSLQLVALVSALLLSVLWTLPFNFSYTDYADAITRMNDDTAYLKFHRRWSESCATLSGSLFAVVCYIAFAGHTSFRGPDGKLSTRMHANYWFLARWVYFSAFALVMYGTIRGTMSIYSLTMMMMPLELHSPVNNTATYAERVSGWEPTDSFGCFLMLSCRVDTSHGDPALYYNGVMNLLASFPATILVPFVLSIALIIKTQTYLNLSKGQPSDIVGVMQQFPLLRHVLDTCSCPPGKNKSNERDSDIFLHQLDRLADMGFKLEPADERELHELEEDGASAIHAEQGFHKVVKKLFHNAKQGIPDLKREITNKLKDMGIEQLQIEENKSVLDELSTKDLMRIYHEDDPQQRECALNALVDMCVLKLVQCHYTPDIVQDS